MMKIEPEQSFLSIFFEVISASGTVGLSLGVTSFLSCREVTSFVMFIEEVGRSLLLAIGQKQVRGKFDYPVGRIMIEVKYEKRYYMIVAVIGLGTFG